ncbi:MAG: hypothetical protein A2664_03385 [Candidatus Taylorbacteria bacterium RIFCSPHIGHO2_01_FULL_46_22b]|uniref:Uncharacterized protein n=1 Tax=Candidatus Taylorbacteria bacterium RIFCSPHIGHO2_01_FULL_46_22b TaxID=1802301 RepID=A0A1G2M180_9BACT|nr:MAG: hypothetical protein A2664_03385 [Candidatus Taylorbacteria bacterium RIFCSPHIGHO2_01_FULL_46_22b]
METHRQFEEFADLIPTNLVPGPEAGLSFPDKLAAVSAHWQSPCSEPEVGFRSDIAKDRARLMGPETT